MAFCKLYTLVSTLSAPYAESTFWINVLLLERKQNFTILFTLLLLMLSQLAGLRPLVRFFQRNRLTWDNADCHVAKFLSHTVCWSADVKAGGVCRDVLQSYLLSCCETKVQSGEENFRREGNGDSSPSVVAQDGRSEKKLTDCSLLLRCFRASLWVLVWFVGGQMEVCCFHCRKCSTGTFLLERKQENCGWRIRKYVCLATAFFVVGKWPWALFALKCEMAQTSGLTWMSVHLMN